MFRHWVMPIFVLFIIFGLPIALVLSWMFEITPEGIKLERRRPIVDAANGRDEKLSPTSHLCRRDRRVLYQSDYFFSDATESRSREARAAAARRPLRKNRSPCCRSIISVATLTTLTFAEGVQDEILTRLAKVADLKVISRTSTQHFKSAPENLPEIAKHLAWPTFWKAACRKPADQVRVNVQLINAMTDAHLWADTYDRKLTDIFAVESEIAKAIAETFQAKLTGAEKSSIAKAPTANPEAYELYLKGRFFWNKRTGDDLRKSIEYLKQAIAKDPGYALAYAALADSYGLLRFYGGASPAESSGTGTSCGEESAGAGRFVS